MHDDNLKSSIAKLTFDLTSVDSLDYDIRSDAIRHTQNNVSSLRNHTKDIKNLHRLLDMVIFYRKLISNFVDIVTPLTSTIRIK